MVMKSLRFVLVLVALVALAATNPASAQNTNLEGFAANDGTAYDQFGTSVSISGNLALVGAPGKQIGSNFNQGKAYVYNCDTSSCTLVTGITANDGSTNDRFGYSVSISGNLALVGAHFKKIDLKTPGKAYVYNCNTAGCSLVTGLTADDGTSYDNFGTSVSISGNLAIVGAPAKTIRSNLLQGKAYVYKCNTASCSLVTGLTANDGAARDQFGYSVSISGNLALVGAPYKTIGSNGGQGKVYVYNCNTASCSLVTGISGDGAQDEYFGSSVSISGYLAIVSSPSKKIGSNSGQGKAYLFSCNTGSCTLVTGITAGDGASHDGFGTSVFISGNLAIVGSPGKTIESNSRQGKGYVYNCNTASCTLGTGITANDSAAYDQFGQSVSISGNLALVGAPNKNFVYLQAPNSVTTTPTATPTEIPAETPTATPTVTSTASISADPLVLWVVCCLLACLDLINFK